MYKIFIKIIRLIIIDKSTEVLNLREVETTILLLSINER